MAGINTKKGEVWIVNLDPGFHREIHKKRPGLIVSSDILNSRNREVVIIPISSQVPSVIGSDMIVVGKKEGLKKVSIILPVFIRSIDQQRLIKKIGKVESSKMQEVQEALKLLLDI